MASDSYNESGSMCTLLYPTVELFKAQFTCLLNYQKSVILMSMNKSILLVIHQYKMEIYPSSIWRESDKDQIKENS